MADVKERSHVGKKQVFLAKGWVRKERQKQEWGRGGERVRSYMSTSETNKSLSVPSVQDSVMGSRMQVPQSPLRWHCPTNPPTAPGIGRSHVVSVQI